MNKVKWFYAILYLANVIGCIVSICMCNLWLFLANFVLSIFFLDRYSE